MTSIVIERADGGVSIMHLIEAEATPESIAAEITKWEEGSNLKAQSWHEIDPAALPADRTFRGAWIHGGAGRVTIDMDKARPIQMDRIRAARDVRLRALDIETGKAVGKGDAAAAADIEARKQALRDIPQTVDLSKAVTPDDLKAIWPEGLPRP